MAGFIFARLEEQEINVEDPSPQCLGVAAVYYRAYIH